MVRLQEHNGQYSLTIPSKLVERKNWKKGQEFIITSDPDARVVILKDGF